jgi:hypothetical protein
LKYALEMVMQIIIRTPPYSSLGLLSRDDAIKTPLDGRGAYNWTVSHDVTQIAALLLMDGASLSTRAPE